MPQPLLPTLKRAGLRRNRFLPTGVPAALPGDRAYDPPRLPLMQPRLFLLHRGPMPALPGARAGIVDPPPILPVLPQPLIVLLARRGIGGRLNFLPPALPGDAAIEAIQPLRPRPMLMFLARRGLGARLGYLIGAPSAIPGDAAIESILPTMPLPLLARLQRSRIGGRFGFLPPAIPGDLAIEPILPGLPQPILTALARRRIGRRFGLLIGLPPPDFTPEVPPVTGGGPAPPGAPPVPVVVIPYNTPLKYARVRAVDWNGNLGNWSPIINLRTGIATSEHIGFQAVSAIVRSEFGAVADVIDPFGSTSPIEFGHTSIDTLGGTVLVDVEVEVEWATTGTGGALQVSLLVDGDVVDEASYIPFPCDTSVFGYVNRCVSVITGIGLPAQVDAGSHVFSMYVASVGAAQIYVGILRLRVALLEMRR